MLTVNIVVISKRVTVNSFYEAKRNISINISLGSIMNDPRPYDMKKLPKYCFSKLEYMYW